MIGNIEPARDKSKNGNGAIRRNVWVITYNLPTKPGDKRKQKRETVHGPKRVAQERLTAVLDSMNKGSYVEPTPLTLSEWLETWLTTYAKVKLEGARSFEMHCSNLRQHVIPKLGTMRLH